MISSIRAYLLINLLMSATLVTCLAIVGSLFLEHKSIQLHLDQQLLNNARQFELVINAQPSNELSKKQWANLSKIERSLNDISKESIPNTKEKINSNYIQVWNSNGQLLLRSAHTPTKPLSKINAPGFHHNWLFHSAWRTITLKDKQKNVTLIMGQPDNYRQQLENGLSIDSIYIFLIAFPLLALLIWLIVGRALAPVNKVAYQLSHRKAAYLDPVNLDNIPAEVKPLIDELNHLFDRLREAFEREKRFAADAAHELRTPLAILSTQAQVAAKTAENDESKQALKKVVNGVKRSEHIIHQLLTMSRMVPQANIHTPVDIDLVKNGADTISDLIQPAINKDIELGMEAPEKLHFKGSKTAIAILLRNLIDNAIRYTPKGGQVTLHLESLNNDSAISIRVVDSGPGIPEELRDRVFERFFRVIGNNATGSGLGLGIVRQISQLHQGQVSLKTPASGKGLEVEVIMPRPQLDSE